MNVTIHQAAMSGNVAAVKRFIETDTSSLRSLDEKGFLPLQYAVLSVSAAIMQMMLETEPFLASLSDGSERRQSAMHWAAVKGSIPACDILLKHGHQLLDQRDANGFNAIHLAAVNGHTQLLHHLAVKHNIDVISGTDGQCRTALHLAAMNGHNDLLKLFLVLDSDISAKDADGRTALHLTAMNGHNEACRTLLLGSSSLVSVEDKKGFTPAQLAEELGHTATVTLITGFKMSERMKREGCFINGRLVGLPQWMSLSGTQLGFLPWLYSAFMTYLYCSFIWPDPIIYPDLDFYSWIAVIGLLCALLLLYQAATIDPGFRPTAWDISKASGEDLKATTRHILDCPALTNGQWQQLCVTCRTVRPLRCVHCSVRDRCVDCYCHWCPWVGNTIGRYNRATLFNFLLVALIPHVLGIIVQIKRIYRVMSLTVSEGSSKIGFFSVPGIFPSLLFIAIALFICGYAGLLILNHGCVGLMRNLTINENTKWQSYKYLTADVESAPGASPIVFHNPFDKGCWRNCAEACLPHLHPVPPSYMKKLFLPGAKIERGRAKGTVYITE
jgi:ankyrin repeat protein